MGFDARLAAEYDLGMKAGLIRGIHDEVHMYGYQYHIAWVQVVFGVDEVVAVQAIAALEAGFTGSGCGEVPRV